MSRLIWDSAGEHIYHTGIDRGVLYVGTITVPWSGLVSVSENPSGGEATPYYLDGQKVLNTPSGEDFDGTIETYAFPLEFAPCAGRIQLAAGFFAGDQPKTPFGFSYRTLVGNDVLGSDFAYRVHIVYNATAQIADFEHGTITESVSLKSYSANFTTVPVQVPGYRAASHYIFDSRLLINALPRAETILYGDQDNDPRMPTAGELQELLAS
jgi:hypothetical protein